jgi:hypothetical protein
VLVGINEDRERVIFREVDVRHDFSNKGLDVFTTLYEDHCIALSVFACGEASLRKRER